MVTKSAATRWDVSVDGCFIGLTRCQTHLVSFSAAGEEISTLLAALLLCHLGFVHPRWPKYAFFFFSSLRCGRCRALIEPLDQRIMHILSLGLPQQLARAL